jgi:DNA-binding transcriptional LysR family regulator
LGQIAGNHPEGTATHQNKGVFLLAEYLGAAMTGNEVRFMEAAIALAEELNFGRAARKLHITQPALTKRIAQLEARLGFPLFVRDHQTVEVNDAGRAYVSEARLALLHSDRAFQAARAVMRDTEVMLNVGKSPYSDPFLASTLLSVHLPLFPQLRVELHSRYSCELAHDVMAGDLDLAIANEPPVSPLLTSLKIAESPFYIGLAEGDELATKEAITLQDVADRCWILFERRLHPFIYDALMQLAKDRGAAPSRLQHVVGQEEGFPSIVEGSGVAFLTKPGARLMARNGVIVRPLSEPSFRLRTYLISRADNRSKPASELVRGFMKKIAGFQSAMQMRLPIAG